MRLGSVAILLLLALSGTLPAQIVPDWFVVELNEAPMERTRGARRVRESQTAARTAMRARLGARAVVKDTVEVVMNALIVQSGASAAELAALPGVRRVWPVYELHPELDRAVDLLRINQAWEKVGGTERAGQGMKIGILDSGLDLKHPGFQTSDMPVPEGYPKGTNEEIRSLLNGKVIVYRTYDSMAGFAESFADNSGHGTGVAMAAAGLKVKNARAEIQGAAPGASLGIYRVFVGPNGGSSNTAIATKAIDDAAADGMDVMNMSFGYLPQIKPEFDPMLPAVERAASLGVMVVKSNGNAGPARLTGSTPTTGSVGLTVGASWSDRVFAAGIRVNGGAPMAAVPGDATPAEGGMEGALRDVSPLDGTGLGCSQLPAGSLAGVVALILRGECTFEVKINRAAAAGASGVIIYTHADSPNPGGMLMGTATLPAMMIGNRDGIRVKAILAETPDSRVTMSYDDSLPFALDSDGVSGFSSRGPGADGSIRPDLVAVGEEILTAAQKTNPDGELYDPSGYTLTNGTSFSSPLVAGAYAVLKAARPGLRAGQYRSLLVNTAQPFPAGEGKPAPVQVGGAGRLDVTAALAGRLAMDPPTLSFGMGGQRVDASRGIRVRNVAPGVGTWKVEVESADAVKAVAEPSEFSLGESDTVDIRVRLAGDLQTGEYQGFLLFRRVDAPEGERPQRVPYWYGVPTGRAATVSLLPSPPTTANGGATVSFSVLITDAVGAGVPDAPVVTVVQGGGTFLDAISFEDTYPGYWRVRVRVGPDVGQENRFRIEAGAVVREVSIRTR